VEDILCGRGTQSFSKEVLYQCVEDLCLHKEARVAHEGLLGLLNSHLGKVRQALVSEGGSAAAMEIDGGSAASHANANANAAAAGADPTSQTTATSHSHSHSHSNQAAGATLDRDAFLSRVDSLWAEFSSQLLLIRMIFTYLDRTYCLQESQVEGVWPAGLRLFMVNIPAHPEVERRLAPGLISLVEGERAGEAVDRSLLKSLVRMTITVGCYQQLFESRFLAASRAHYAAEGLRLVQELEVTRYLVHVSTRLAEEGERLGAYLDQGTRRPLLGLVDDLLLRDHVATLLTRGFDGMMTADPAQRLQDLARLYSLLSRVAALDRLKVALSAYVKRCGAEIVSDPEKDDTMVVSLLDFKQQLDTIVKESFASNEAFVNAIKEAFEACINMRQNRPSELIAKFMDAALRGGNKGLTDEDLDESLDRAVMLFRFVQGKDVFEAFYKKDLAKRLLLGKSASVDAEKMLLSKLKQECGSTFTNRLEGMFKDMEVSRELNLALRAKAEADPANAPAIELTVNVLTMGYWPSYTPTDARLPEDVARLQESFKAGYIAKHQGRRLVWINSLGHATLRSIFPSGVKELSVSVHQALVLLLFNAGTDALSLAQIAEATGIQDKELRRTLQSLACAKVQPLRKEPKSRDVEDGDVFHFNHAFTHKLTRVKINTIVQVKETAAENTETHEKVFQDRQYAIDAAIVRIMKARKTLSHSLLIAELLESLKFPVTPQDLKKRIESLIEREYLERDAKNGQIYTYLA
jgi:cullin-4